MGPEIDLFELRDALYDRMIPDAECMSAYHPEFLRCFQEVQKIIEEFRLQWEKKMEEMAKDLGQQDGLITAERHENLLAEVEQLITLDPAPKSLLGRRLALIADLIEQYEKEHFPFEKPTPLQVRRFRAEERKAEIEKDDTKTH